MHLEKINWIVEKALSQLGCSIGWMIVPARPIDTGPLWDWSPPLVIFKDLSIFAMFGVVYITNIYNFILAAEHLVWKRQFHTVRECLAGDRVALGRLPTTVLYMPFHWAVVAATFVAVFLLILELNAYTQLYDYERVPENAWIVGMGLLRDAIFIILAFEVLCWYWISLTAVKKSFPGPA